MFRVSSAWDEVMWGSDRVKYIRVAGPKLLNCARTPGNVAMLANKTLSDVYKLLLHQIT
jgi:hypothetical protein